MAKSKQPAHQPLILRAHRLMEAFAKSDDERDFYLDRQEGFIIYVDLDKPEPELDLLEKEVIKNSDRYCMIPKLTFYETKKIMEGFVNEKIYDIDTKEKLLDIIQAKEARSNFLEFIYDHHAELEKWQQYYQERSRIRIIEWLRNNHFHFVFEEDLDFARSLLEKLKASIFEQKPAKEIVNARKTLVTKAKSYYSNEALNPRPKRGRPPKQVAKQELEPQITSDLYITVPPMVRPFLFTPDISSASAVTFSSDFDAQGSLKKSLAVDTTTPENIQQKLAALRKLSSQWIDADDDEDEDDEEEKVSKKVKSQKAKNGAPKAPKSVKNGKIVKKTNKVEKKPLRSIMPVKPDKSKKKAKKPTPNGESVKKMPMRRIALQKTTAKSKKLKK